MNHALSGLITRISIGQPTVFGLERNLIDSLADILIWLALFGVVKEDHLLTSKYFGTVLYTIDPGG
jgi:hypothetical protein